MFTDLMNIMVHGRQKLHPKERQAKLLRMSQNYLLNHQKVDLQR